MNLDAKIPSGDLANKWTQAKFEMKLVSPANKRRYRLGVIGSGLAGASAAATLAAVSLAEDLPPPL